MIPWLLYLFIGMLAGLGAGLFGLGGGLIVVPALVIVYQFQGVNPEFIMHMAVSTSLMTIVITSLSSTYSHHRHQHINWSIVGVLTPALLLGGLSGSFLAVSLSSRLLQYFFTIYTVFAAIKVWLPSPSGYSSSLLNKPQLSVFGFIAGNLSALIGVGGGTFTVPYLVTAHQTIKRAIGTSAACTFPIALSAVLGFVYFGSDVILVDDGSHTGFIDWHAFWGIVMTSALFARVGANLAEYLPVLILQRIFSLLLLIVAIKMCFELT